MISSSTSVVWRRVVVLVLATLLAGLFLIPSLLGGQRCHSNESSAIGNLRTFVAAQQTFYDRYKCYGTADELIEEQLVDPHFRDGTVRSDYLLRFRLGCDRQSFEAEAFPVQRPSWWGGARAKRFFCTNESGQIHFNTTRPASVSDPALGM